MIYSLRMSFVIVLMAALLAGNVPPPPAVIAQAQVPITVEAGDYILVGLSPILAPGERIGQHSHRGPDLIVVFEGEVIEQEPGGDRTVKAGESWINQAGEVHAVTNGGDTKARLWATLLLPVGDTSVMPAAQMPLNVKAGEYSLIGRVLDFASGSGLPEQYHGGNALFYVMEGEITLLENGATKQVKAFKSWTEGPGAVYSVTNSSENNTRIAVSMLLPKGAEETTFVSTPTPLPTQVVTNVSTPTSSTTQDVPNSTLLSVLIGVGVLIILAVGFYLRRGKG
jgi:quercetin dioxygenase-like cupin family protein